MSTDAATSEDTLSAEAPVPTTAPDPSAPLAVKIRGVKKCYQLGTLNNKTLRDGIIDRLRKSDREPANAFWALKGVDLDIRRGEVVGLIGRNGAGKSTLLKVLSRIAVPTEGAVDIWGRVGSLLEVGTGFHPELSGRENVYLNGSILGMTRREIDVKFDEIVDFSGVEKFLETPVKRYSSGMYVRLAFAVAAHLEPEVLIVDEVLAVGDAEFQRKCLGKMQDVAGHGRTVIFVSHNMSAVASLCTRAVLMDGGRVAFDGSPDEAVSAYFRHTATDSTRRTDRGFEVDLSRHGNRKPGCEPLLQTLGFEMPTASMGASVGVWNKPLRLKIGYHFPKPVTSPEFVMTFSTTMGLKVFTLHSSHQTNDISGKLEGRGEVVCEIPSLPLNPGEYYVTIRLWQPGNLLDEIEGVTILPVERLGSDGRSGKWTQASGPVYVDATWKRQ